MIFDADWRREFLSDIFQRLAHAHPDMTRIAASLRDSAGVDVWTENPSDRDKMAAGKQHYSLEGWRVHYKLEYARLNAWNATHGTKLQGYDPQAKTALDGYLVSLPAIAGVLNTTVNKYKDAQGRIVQTTIAQADRDALAAAIEAELQ